MEEKKDVVIDEKYSGLVDDGWCFRLAGYLNVSGSITIKLPKWLIVSGGIKAGEGIEAGWGIEAGGGIEAGWGIEAGGGIKAGEGIEAGLQIICKILSAGLRIFAGLCIWRRPAPEEMTIQVERLASGEVCFGTLQITPTNALPAPEDQKEGAA